MAEQEDNTVRNRILLLLVCAVVIVGTAGRAQSPKPYTLHYEVRLKSASFGNMGVRKLWLKGDRMRWEWKSANLPIRLIKNDQGVFMLHPWNKIAARYPKGSPRGNPTALLPGPSGSPNVFLKAVKAVKSGSKTLEGTPCAGYSYTEPTTKRNCVLWVSTKSGRPVQLLLKGKNKQMDTVTATYTKFVECIGIADSLFEVPKGFAIRPMPETQRLTSKSAQKHRVAEGQGIPGL